METSWFVCKTFGEKVLIVPCGMETDPGMLYRFVCFVLIVPCGMETTFVTSKLKSLLSINCTLRNGNNGTKAFSNKPGKRINCTLRNGNGTVTPVKEAYKCINCTLRNGNSLSTSFTSEIFPVLIVPCGMETRSASTIGSTRNVY